MAITVSTLANSGNKNAEASTAVTGITAAVGDLILVCLAADNAGTNGASAVGTPTDSASNTYTQTKLQNRTAGSAVNDGCTSAIYQCLIPAGKSLSGGTITLNWSPNVTAKAWVILKVQGFASATAASTNAVSGTGTSYTGNATPSMATGDLVVSAVANESNTPAATDSDTSNGSWSAVTGASGGTGADATKMSLSVQYKIVTGAGTQTNNAATGANTDYAQVQATYTAPETKSGSGSLSATAGFTSAGTKAGKGTGTVSVVFGATPAGKKAGAGTGSLAAASTLSVGGDAYAVGTNDQSGTSTGGLTEIVGTKYTLDAGTYVDALWVYTPNAGNVVAAIYANNGGAPGTLIVSDSNTPTAAGANAWTKVPIPRTWLDAGTYWLTFMASANNMRAYKAGGTNQTAYNLATVYNDTWPNTFPTSSYQSNDYIAFASISGAGVKAAFAAGTLSATVGMDATGGKGIEQHSGTGTMSVAFEATVAGTKAGAGVGTATVAFDASRAGAKAGAGTGAVSVTADASHAGTKAGAGVGTMSPTVGMDATGQAVEQHTGSATMSVTFEATPVGTKAGSGVGTTSAVFGASTAAIKATSGVGTLANAFGASTAGIKATAGVGTVGVVVGATPNGAKRGVGVGTASAALEFAAGGTRATTGIGSVSVTVGMSEQGAKKAAATGAVSVTVGMDATGGPGVGGNATMDVVASLVAVGVKRGAGVGALTVVPGVVPGVAIKAGRGVGALATPMVWTIDATKHTWTDGASVVATSVITHGGHKAAIGQSTITDVVALVAVGTMRPSLGMLHATAGMVGHGGTVGARAPQQAVAGVVGHGATAGTSAPQRAIIGVVGRDGTAGVIGG